MDRREKIGGDFSATDERCEQIRPLLSLYVDRMASAEEIRAIELHLAGCKDCDSSYEWMLATHDVLASRPCAIPPADMSLRIHAAIAASREAEKRQVVRFRTSYRPALAFAATAIIAAVTFGVFHHGTQPGGPSRPMVAVRPAPEPAVTPQPHITPVTPPARPKSSKVATVPEPATPKVNRIAPVRREAPPAIVAKVPEANTDIAAPTRVGPHDSAPVHITVKHPVVRPHQPSLVANVPHPEPHKQPVPSPIRHSDPVVATSHVPEPTAPEAVAPPTVIEHPEPTHPTMVAATTPSVPRSNSLLADVQGHVSTMSRQRAYNDSFRINRSAGDAHVASYETPTDIGNHGESVSGFRGVQGPY